MKTDHKPQILRRRFMGIAEAIEDDISQNWRVEAEELNDQLKDINRAAEFGNRSQSSISMTPYIIAEARLRINRNIRNILRRTLLSVRGSRS